jgi:4-amino-4-deoxy-L-arabinose transferase-like glycosyltransferase
MNFFKKHKLEFIILTTLTTAYFISRFYNILSLPIFTDESIYIYWAKYIAVNHSHWFMSLIDGKPPLLIWAIAVFLTALPQNLYLLAGRLPSVFAGAISLIGMYYLALLLFRSRRVGIISSALYIINPFILFYDRMALFDSLLSSMLIWSVYFAIRTGQKLRKIDSVLWGLFLGLAFLAKPTAIIILIMTPVFMVIFSDLKKIKQNFKKLVLLASIMLVVSQAINNVQRLSNTFPLAAIKNAQFQLPLKELLADPFQLLVRNLYAFFSWIIPYYTLPVFVFGILCFIFLFFKEFKKAVVLFSLWLFPIFIFAMVGREIFPRYILFTTPYFLLPIAYVIGKILYLRKRAYVILGAVLIGIVFYSSVSFSFKILNNPAVAPFPLADLQQYVTQHPSGYGLNSVFAFLHKEENQGKINVITQGTFGLYPYAFYLEFWNDPNVNVLGRWPLDKIDPDMRQIQKTQKLYIILKEHDVIPAELPVQLVFKATKPGNHFPILVTTLKE